MSSKLVESVRGFIRREGYTCSAALLLANGLLVKVLNEMFGTSLRMGIVYSGLTLLLWVWSELENRRDFRLPRVVWLLAYVLAFMLVSLVVHSFLPETKACLIDFVVFGISGAMLGARIVNTEKLLRYSLYLSLLALPVLPMLLTTHLRDNSVYLIIQMGLSYSILPFALMAVSHFVYYRKKRDVLMLLAYLQGVAFLVGLLLFGTRGATLAIAFFLLLMLLHRYRSKAGQEPQVRHHYLGVGIAIVLLVLAFLFQDQVYQLLKSLGIRITSLEKNNLFSSLGISLLHGREKYYRLALSGIPASPIWGHGIGAFHAMAKSYPHNLVLDLMYDGGLLLTIPIMLVALTCLVRVVVCKVRNREEYVLLVLLLSLSLPKLMISRNLWGSQEFWLLIGYGMAQADPFKKARGFLLARLGKKQ